MISSQQLLAAAAVAFIPHASAIAFAGPKATAVVPDRVMNGWSPKPTRGPSPAELRKRQFDSAATCGWVNGIYSSEIGCPIDATCMLFTDVSSGPGMAGCCTDFDYQNCYYAATCIDYSSLKSGGCNGDCMRNSFIKKCTDALSPYCISWTYASDNVQDYGCGTEIISSFETLYQDITDADNFITTSLALEYVPVGAVTGFDSTASASAAVASATGKSSKTTTAVSNTLASAASSSTSTPSTTKKSKTNVPLIAGIAGGIFLVVLAAAGLLIFCCLRRKHKKTTAAANAASLANASRPQSQYYNPATATPQMQQQPPPMPPPQHSYFGQPGQPYGSGGETKFAAQYASSPVSAPPTPAPAYQTPVGVQSAWAPPPPPVQPQGVSEVDATSRPHVAPGGGPVYEIGVGR